MAENDTKQIQGNSMGKTEEFNPGVSCPNEILQLLLEDIKRAQDPGYEPHQRYTAVQNYKAFCEAELTRTKTIEANFYMELHS